MLQDIERVLVSEEALHGRITELGAQLTKEYAGKDPVVVGILRGVVPFFAEMALAINTPCQWDFLSVSSYEGTASTGTVTFRKDLDIDIKGRHVLILEDILDSGRTLKYIRQLLLERGPASLKICTLLDKPSGRTVELEADYTGFTIPGAFAVGYGLDYDGYYRNLPFVGVLKPAVYEK